MPRPAAYARWFVTAKPYGGVLGADLELDRRRMRPLAAGRSDRQGLVTAGSCRLPYRATPGF